MSEAAPITTRKFMLLDSDGLERFRELMEAFASSEDDEPMTAAEWIAECDHIIDEEMNLD